MQRANANTPASTGSDDEPHRDVVDLSSALATIGLAAVRYQLAPGEGFPSGLHAHDDQEETFVVLAGEAVFEFLPPVDAWPVGDAESTERTPPTGCEVTVAAREAVRFAPGEFQTGRNPETADADLVALALGAPRETDDVRIPARCRACDAPALRLGTGGSTFTFDCPDCDATFEPAPCRDCGSHDLGMHLDTDGHPISRCADCGNAHETVPLVD